MVKKNSPIYFYRDPKGWWQIKVLFVFLFSNNWGFGFRLFDIGLNIWIRRFHANSVTTRGKKGLVLFEFLPPCNMGHPYWSVKRWLNPGATFIEP